MSRKKRKTRGKKVEKKLSGIRIKPVLAILIGAAVIGGIFLKISLGRKVEDVFSEGKILHSKGQFKEACSIFEKLSERVPDFHKNAVAYLRADCLYNTGRFPEAKLLWKTAVEGDESNKYLPESLYKLARMEEKEGEYEKAAAFYDRIVKDFANSVVAEKSVLALAGYFEKQKDWERAEKAYLELITGSSQENVVKEAKEKLGDLNTRLIFSPVMTEHSQVYEVKKGDTLEEIADDFNTTVELIMEANGLKSPIFKPGKRLKITPGKFSIYVDVESNSLTLKLNGMFFKEYPAGTGKFESTPAGEFKIVNKQMKPVWYAKDDIYPYGHPKNILGTRWMGLDKPGYGIHGTTQPESVGKDSSAGCIRLYNKDVEELFKLVAKGTPVIIGDLSQDVSE